MYLFFDIETTGLPKVRNASIKNLNNWPRMVQQRFCTMKTTTELCQIAGPYGYKWPKLAELYYHLFKKDFKDAHDAIVDVEACAKCFFELIRVGFIKVDKK